MTFDVTIFDYNGVLVDDEAVHLEAFRDALAPLGVAVDETQYWERYIGFDDREGFAAMLEDAGKTPHPHVVEQLVDAKRPLYLKRAELELKTFPGASELVRDRAARGPTLVVSGALRAEIEFGLSRLDVSECIAHIVAAEDTQASKPDPEGYLLALDWLAESGQVLTPNQALVIEDSLAGIAAAKAAGCCCIAVAHSYPFDKLQASGADAVVASIRDVTEEQVAKLYARTH